MKPDTLFIGKKIFFEEKTSSTNIFLNELLQREKLPEGTVVMTSFQENGKGYTTNKWESEAGKNILMSVLLHPCFIKPNRQFFLNQLICVAIVKAIDEFAGVESKIKWPNDIYIGDKKLGGVLIENVIQGEKILQSIIGIGINVNQKKFSSSIPNAVSLSKILKKNFNLISLSEKILEYLEAEYLFMKENKIEKLQEEYMSRLYRCGEEHEFIFQNKKQKAKIWGLNPEGKLLLQTDENWFAFSYKEVEFVI